VAWTGPGSETAPYWRGLAEGQLRLLLCGACRAVIHYPAATCPRCRGRASVYEPVPARGVVHTFTVVHREFAPGVAPPYVVALVELDAAPGVRILTNVVGATVGAVRVGLPVTPLFHRVADDIGLLFYRPAPAAGRAS